MTRSDRASTGSDAGSPIRVIASRHASATRTFVLIHGIGMSHRYLRRLHAHLASADTVVSIDLPGFGGLARPERDLDVPEMASRIADVLDRGKYRDVVAVGHSMGCQWVVELALHRPDLVSHVVALGPVVDDRHRTVLAQARALARDILREPLSANWLVLSDYLRCGIPWYLTQLRHMIAYPLEARLGALTRPLLIVRGGRDPVAGATWCRRLRDAAPDAAFVEIPRSGHVVQHHAPAVVASALRSFLSVRPGGTLAGGSA